METTFLESLSADQALTAIYIGYYNRAPDPVGFNFWAGVLADGFDLNNDGNSLDDLASNFAGQPETLTVHSFFSNPTDASASAFVTELYANLFNRGPDTAGLEFWTGQLSSAIAGEGSMSVGEIILAIIGGAQSAADGGFPDQESIANKIEVGLAWKDASETNTIEFEGDAVASAAAIIAGVDSTADSVTEATADIAAFVLASGPTTPVEPDAAPIALTIDAVRDNLTGTGNNDTFEAYNAELSDGDRVNGGAGNDVLEYFSSEDRAAISATTVSVETVVATIQTNDRDSDADNNVGGFNNNGSTDGDDGTTMVDVELDAGRMVGVDRWEDYDSRADLVIEDARDDNPNDGTFTADIVVAMVSTDPGNVDFAVYFDGPVNQPGEDTSTVTLQILDNDGTTTTSAAAITGNTTGVLTDAGVSEFVVNYNGELVTVELFDQDAVNAGTISAPSDVVGATATYNTLAAAIQTAINANATLGGEGISVTLGSTFVESAGAINPVGLGTTIFGLNIVIEAQPGNELEAVSRLLYSDDPSRSITARLDDAVAQGADDLISLQVQLDDVGKGSMGGDAMFGAMSTGRQADDDGTSDSIGIQQFDITVDRGSQLQTINSTNNALEVVNITNGANTGPNATAAGSGATDEEAGDLVVRGQANPDDVQTVLGQPALGEDGSAATDGAMPGASPQHNNFGFSDVRVINASSSLGNMVGDLDLTAELTAETVEKYLDIEDSQIDGELDDVAFTYTMGTGNDEFLLQMSDAALNAAGTGSREDFDMTINGGTGNDVITTNIGADAAVYDAGALTAPAGAQKVIDAQGEDHYELTSTMQDASGWYYNSVANDAATFTVVGGTGNDDIWTHGWGNFTIADGTGTDVVYTDNSAATQLSDLVLPVIERNLPEDEEDQIDYVVGDAWAFNAEGTVNATTFDISGITNNSITLGTVAGISGTTPLNATTGSATITVSFAGAGGAVGTAYTTTATIPLSALTVGTTTGVISIDEQELNQAIKRAINEDDILENLLEAVDGPGNSLVVYSKTDGDYAQTDLGVALTNVTINNAAVVVTPLAAGGAYDTAGAGVLFTDGGVASMAESDNLLNITGDNENDLFVLSTSDTAFTQPTGNGALDNLSELNSASNEVLAFDMNFGRDTVLNFDAGDGNGFVDGAEDVLDFDSVFADNSFSAGPVVGGAIVGPIVDGYITVTAETVANNTLAEVQALYTGFDTAVSVGSREEIVIVYDANDDNAGTVYTVTDGIAVGDVAVAQVGIINLVGTDWSTLTADNFA